MSNFTNNNRININTSVMTIWDPVTGNQLRVSLYNNALSIAIWIPFVDAATGTRKYPAELRYSVLLSPKAAYALEDVIMNKILPAYNTGADAKGGVFTNNNNTNMIEVEASNGEFMVLIHQGIDPSMRIPKNTARFKFESTPTVDSYDSATGEIVVNAVQADFFVFVKAIRAFNDLCGGLYASHGTHLASHNANAKVMETLRAIADAVHAQLPVNNYQNYQNRGYNNGGVVASMNPDDNTANSNVPDVTPVELTSLTDLIQ